MSYVEKILSWISFGLICIPVVIGPWIFGSWEVWFFWPMATLIFVSAALFSLRLFLILVSPGSWTQARFDEPSVPKLVKTGIIAYLLFLAYAFVQFLRAEVFMDAERSFLLHLTPFLLGIQIIFGFDRKLLRFLSTLMLVNFLFLGVYGIINHIFFHNAYVMWLPGEPTYQQEIGFRATGSYICPDHFSGIMELALSAALGVLLAKQSGWKWRAMAGLLAFTALCGIVFSKSRGGGLTVIVLAVFVVALGFANWPIRVRRLARATILVSLVASLVIFCSLKTEYMTRFKAYFKWDEVRKKPAGEWVFEIRKGFKTTCRGVMWAGALRAWQTSPVFGIGPGMHQNLWPHFASSGDGSRELGIWPSMLNNEWHSYEVHNDWLQLLEEYGLAGLLLFLIPVMILLSVFFRELFKLSREDHDIPPVAGAVSSLLAGFFAVLCMVFHSFGDFNLQMPATVWMLAAMICIPLAYLRMANAQEDEAG